MIPILLTLAIGQQLEKLPNKPVAKVAYADVVQSIKDSSVRVEVRTKDIRTGKTCRKYACGTVIHADKGGFYVLTCAHGLYTLEGHCVPSAIVQGPVNGGTQYEGWVVAESHQRDVAVLKVSAEKHPFKASAVAWDGVWTKLPIIRCGYPEGKYRYLVHGRLTGRTAILHNTPSAKAVGVWPDSVGGMSGGGVFRESDGKLLAVTSVVTHAAALSSVEYILDKAKIKGLVK